MAASRPRLLQRLALDLVVLVVGFLVALLLFEVLLRVHNPFFTRIRGQRIVLEVNRRLRLKNGAVRGLDPEVTFTRNALGFRGPNPPAHFERSLTLVTIGGSTTQCTGLADDSTWTARLGRHLSRSFRDVWIDNAGLNGHSTFGHLILLEDWVAPLHPKLAVFLVGANDVGRDAVTEFDAENARMGLAFGSFQSFLKSASAHSEVAALALDAYRTWEAHRASLADRRLELGRMGHREHSPAELQAYLARFASPRYRAQYADRLRRLIAVARGHGIEPVFVTQPLLVGPAVDDVTGIDLGTLWIRGNMNGEFMWAAQEAYNDVTRRVCADSAVTLADLARQMPKSTRYYYDVLHFTNPGAERVAEILARDLCPELARRYPEFAVRGCEAGADASVARSRVAANARAPANPGGATGR